MEAIVRAPRNKLGDAVLVDRAKAANSILWSAIENGGLAVISFASLVIYSRWLSPADFGLFSIVFALVELLGVLVSMLFHDALVQRKDVSERHFDTAFTFTIGLSLTLMFACMAMAPLFARLVDHADAAPVLAWMSLCFPCAGVTATIVARQRRNFSFRSLALRSLVARIAGAAVGIALVVLGAGLWGLVAQQILILLMGSLVLWLTAAEHPRLRFGLIEFKQLISFGAVSVSALLLMFSVKRLFTILAGLLLGTQAAGILNLATRTIDVFWAIAATAVSQVALPMLANLQQDRGRLKRAYLMANQYTCVVLYFSFATLGLLSQEIVELLFGKQWLPSAPYMTALALLIVVQAPKLFNGAVLTAAGRPRDLLVGVGLELALIVLAVLCFGIPSVEWAVGIWMARELISAPLMSWLLRRATGFGLGEQFRGTVIPLVAAVAMAVAIPLARHAFVDGVHSLSRLGVLMVVGVVVFFGTVSILDRKLLPNMLRFARAAVLEREAKHG